MKLRLRDLLLCCAALLPLCGHAGDEDFSGTVTKVFDGDSFLVRPAGRKDIDVRLLEIDAPEKNQAYGDEARAALLRLIGGRRVYVDVIDTDKYGRMLARVYREPDRLEIARTLVHDGHAWVYRRTVRDATLIKLEDTARGTHTGLWALPQSERIPPWQYRYLERKRKQSASAQDTATRE